MITLQWHPARAGSWHAGSWSARDVGLGLWLDLPAAPVGSELPAGLLDEVRKNITRRGRVRPVRVVAVDAIDRGRWRVYVRPAGGAR